MPRRSQGHQYASTEGLTVHHLLIALATAPAPSPTPSLRPGLSEDQVTPGMWGFIMTAFFVLATTLLIVDMVRRIRRVRYRAQVEEERMAALAAGDQDMLDGAGNRRFGHPDCRHPGLPAPRPPAPRAVPASGRNQTVMKAADAASGGAGRTGSRRSPARGRQCPGRGTFRLPAAARRQPGPLAALRR